MTLQSQINTACAAQGYLPQAILVAPEFAAACRKGRELFDWEAGGGMERVIKALEHPTSNIQPRAVKAVLVREYNPKGKEEEVLNRMNGHPMKLGELRGELNVMTLHQVLNRLVARKAVRKVRHGYYEKVVHE